MQATGRRGVGQRINGAHALMPSFSAMLRVQEVAPVVSRLPEQTRFCPLFGTSIVQVCALPSLSVYSMVASPFCNGWGDVADHDGKHALSGGVARQGQGVVECLRVGAVAVDQRVIAEQVERRPKSGR